MNKLYKVVWNKSRNCYVVASEFAKTHQTGVKRIKSVSITAFMAVCLLTGTQLIFAENIEEKSTAIGDFVKVNDFRNITVSDSIVLPNNEESILLGQQAICAIEIGCNAHAVTGSSIAIGNQSVAYDRGSVAIGAFSGSGEKSVALGWSSYADNHSVALGGNAKAIKEGSVALGYGSQALTPGGVIGLWANCNEIKSPIWKSTTGAISLGGTDKWGITTTRQITNLAAGREDTDAVNVAQLKKAKTEVKAGTNVVSVTLKKGKNGQDIYTINAKGAEVTGDNNIKVTSVTDSIKNITTYNVKLNNIIRIGSQHPITIDGTKGHITGLTNTTIDMFDFAKKGRAATEEQLKAVKDTVFKGWKLTTNRHSYSMHNITPDTIVDFTGDQNIKISNFGSDVIVALNNKLKNITSISNGEASIAMGKSGNVVINNRIKIDKEGKINGVAVGKIEKGSTDAVNGSQLYQTNERVTKTEREITAIGKNITDITANMTNIDNKVTNIDKKVTNIDKKVINIDNRVSKIEQTAGKHSSVSSKDKNIVVEEINDKKGIDYKVGLNKKKISLENVTIEGEKGNITAKGTITAGKTSISDKGVMVGKNTYISEKGINANNQKITNVADGSIAENSKEAVNGGQLFKINQGVINLNGRINSLDTKVNRVGAGAAALAALHPMDFDPDDKWDFAAGYGNYRGANAVAVGAYYRPNEDTMFSVGGSFGNGERMLNAGISFKFGQGNHVSTSRVAMAKELKAMREHMAAQDKLIAQLVAPVNVLTGSHINADLNTLFPDVPKNHWAYEYVTKLAQAGYVEGYPDGSFQGDAMMTRYEFAAIIYRAMMKGAAQNAKFGSDERLNRLLNEFKSELEYIRVDTIQKDKNGKPTVQRVRTAKNR